jgi:serine phosphatase RsbU (regulator of sigma subunit)
MKALFLILLLFITGLSIAQTNIPKLELRLKTATGTEQIILLNSLATAYLHTQPEKSIDYAEKALKLNKKNIASQTIEGNLYNTLGSAYYMIGDYKKSVKNYEKELDIIEKSELDAIIMKANYNIATIYEILKNDKAEDYFLKSLVLAQKIKSDDVILKIYEQLAVIYSKKDYEKSVYYFIKYFDAKNVQTKQKNEILASQYDEILTQKKDINILEVNEKELIKDTTQKSLEIISLDELNRLQQTDIKQKGTIIRQGRIIIFVSVSISILILFFLGLFYRLFIRVKKLNLILNQKNGEINKHMTEIKNKNKEITAKSEILTQQKKEITDSIVYASLIQKAILPSPEIISEHFVEHFILYRPCKIVSGDFYWFRQIKNLLFVVAADCTGHGVPGAFMSMLGISLLNDIVNRSNVNHPHETLNELRKRIKKSLHQTGQSGERQDGMDIAFCMIDLETNTVEYSGAYNPFYLVRNNELIEFKANRMPIGVYPKDDQDFVTTTINLQPNDKFYIFSDGYVSQFGGMNGKKFKTTQFREILIRHYDKSMTSQKELLEEALDGWQGEMDQVDDILVIGINID